MATKKGTEKNDRLNGTNGDDVLYGLGGNDKLDGGTGHDDLMGGDGNDEIIGRYDGSDAIDGGKGTDVLDYSRVSTGITVILGVTDKGYTSKVDEYDYFAKIEVFLLSKDEDTYIGTAGAHDFQVFGGDGDDVISGYGSVMRGDAGADVLIGGNETIETFWLQRGKGADTVATFSSGQDMIWLDSDDFDLGAKIGYREYVLAASPELALGSKAQLIFDYNAGALYYDEDGNGTKTAELLATFTNADGYPNVFDIEIL